MLRRGCPAARDEGGPVVTSPAVTLKTVCLREDDLGACGSGCLVVDGGGGGGTEKRARSWVSVSRMREVMSWLERRALVKILGGGKLQCRLASLVGEGRERDAARTGGCLCLGRTG